MPRNKPYYSKRQILNLISAGKVIVKYQAKESALNDFGWRREAIYKAISALTLKCWYKSEPRYDNPQIFVDYYRARNIRGVNFYTHFYLDGENLVIDSFHKLGN